MECSKPPSLDHLRTFLAVYRAGSFSNAARRLSISQPTVTNHVAILERQLGGELFERRVNGASPTAHAHELASMVAPDIDHLDRMFTGSLAGEQHLWSVAMGGPREFLAHCVLPALTPAIGELPRLEVTFGPSRQLLTDLESRQLDIVISTVRPRRSDIQSWPIADEEFWLVAAPSLGVSTGSVSEISTTPIVSYSKNLPIIRRFWNSVYGAEPNFDLTMVLPDLDLIKEAVLGGHGLSVLPSYLVRQEVDDGRLMRVDHATEPPINTVFLAIRRPIIESRHGIIALATMLVQRIKQHEADQLARRASGSL
ncbi:LysR family transcriptional regulator [Gordonia iterans]